MKLTNTLLLSLIMAMISLTACDDSSTGTEEPTSDVEIQQVEDLEATGENGEFTFFSLRTGQQVEHADSASADWDVAFKESEIIFNSGDSGPGSAGVLALDLDFDQVEIAPSEGYEVDGEELAIPAENNNGWYTYTGNSNPPHAMLPKEDYTIVVKTGDGNHYAKVEILSYYKGNPDTSSDEFVNDRPDPRFYTFRYAIQQTEGLRELK